MSTDVYIDFRIPGSNKSKPVRIGHHGTMSYFQINLLECLRLLSWAQPSIDEHLAVILPRMFDAFRKSNEVLEKEDPEYIAGLYGYYPGDWDDVMTAEEADKMLSEHMGDNWSIRVD